MTGQEIKALRKKLKITQQQLADAIGVDRVTVARWETDHKRPSNLARRQLARLFNNINNKQAGAGSKHTELKLINKRQE